MPTSVSAVSVYTERYIPDVSIGATRLKGHIRQKADWLYSSVVAIDWLRIRYVM